MSMVIIRRVTFNTCYSQTRRFWCVPRGHKVIQTHLPWWKQSVKQLAYMNQRKPHSWYFLYLIIDQLLVVRSWPSWDVQTILPLDQSIEMHGPLTFQGGEQQGRCWKVPTRIFMLSLCFRTSRYYF